MSQNKETITLENTLFGEKEFESIRKSLDTSDGGPLDELGLEVECGMFKPAQNELNHKVSFKSHTGDKYLIVGAAYWTEDAVYSTSYATAFAGFQMIQYKSDLTANAKGVTMHARKQQSSNTYTTISGSANIGSSSSGALNPYTANATSDNTICNATNNDVLLKASGYTQVFYSEFTYKYILFFKKK